MAPKIPFLLMLRKELQKKIARAQDLIIKEMQESLKGSVLHGGTAIWRCYSGNRFSEDVDVYVSKNLPEIEGFFSRLETKGFTTEKKKMNENCLYSSLLFEGVHVRFEALFKKVKGELKDYELVDGNFITLRTLLPEELIKEKVAAYLKRLKIRDLYDIFFLLKHVDNKKKVSSEINKLLKEFKSPEDTKDLQILILSGITPTVSEMLSYIQREVG